MIALKTFEENASGASRIGSPDPAKWQLHIPSPPEGYVRVPLSASIQCDSRQPFVTCHGRLERTDGPLETGIDVSEFMNGSTTVYMGDPPRATHLLWSLKLTPGALLGGEFFIPVPAVPLVHGTMQVAEWSYATGYDAVRTRAVTMDIPIYEFDWNQFRPLTGQPQHSVIRHETRPRTDWPLAAALPFAPALWRWRRMQRSR